jgi:hypothetical protein
MLGVGPTSRGDFSPVELGRHAAVHRYLDIISLNWSSKLLEIML